MPKPPTPHTLTPILILATGVLAAAAILAGAVLDSTPPRVSPLPADVGPVARTPDDPANSSATTP